jgi:hypothetical protein
MPLSGKVQVCGSGVIGDCRSRNQADEYGELYLMVGPICTPDIAQECHGTITVGRYGRKASVRQD